MSAGFGSEWNASIIDTCLDNSAPAMIGFGALTAVVMSAYDFTGGSLRGFKKDKEIDDFERKEALRLNRRRPIDQTISELGEGRGMCGDLGRVGLF